MSPDPSLCMLRASNTSKDTDYYNDLTYKTYTNGPLYTNIFDDGQFVLQNGMLVMIENPNSQTSHQIFISIDINGKKKGPNKFGYDLFTFELVSDGRLLPMGADGTSYPGNSYCSKDSNSKINGIACANKALNDPKYFRTLP